MCLIGESESGHGGRFEPCDAYIKLLSEKSRLEGRCAGLELGNKINLESIKRQDERMAELLKENEALREQLSVARNFAKQAGDRCEVLRQENVEYDRINSEQAQEIGRLKQDRDRLEKLKDEIIQERDVAGRALELARQDRDRLAVIVEKADAMLKFSVPFLCRNSADAKDCLETPYNCLAGACGYALCRACVAYQEGRHG